MLEGEPVPAYDPAGGTVNEGRYHCYGFEKCMKAAGKARPHPRYGFDHA